MATLVQLVLFVVFCIVVALLIAQDHLENQLSDIFVIPLAVSGVSVNFFALIVGFEESLLGAGIGLFGIQAFRIWQKYRYGVTGIGYGDAKFLSALGAWLGIHSIPLLLVGASLLTLMLYLRRQEKPFGVGLGLSAIFLFGLQLIG